MDSLAHKGASHEMPGILLKIRPKFTPYKSTVLGFAESHLPFPSLPPRGSGFEKTINELKDTNFMMHEFTMCDYLAQEIKPSIVLNTPF